MAYLTLKEIDPKQVVQDDGDGTFTRGAVGVNEQSFPYALPIKRLAWRRLLETDLSEPLYDKGVRELGVLCPVIDAARMPKQRVALLRKFLPKHLTLVQRGDEMHIVENFDWLANAYEEMFQTAVAHEMKVWALHIKPGVCNPSSYNRNHAYCSYGDIDDKLREFAGMTSAQALHHGRFNRPEYDMIDEVYENNHPLKGTDLGYNRWGTAAFYNLWRWLMNDVLMTWRFEVSEDADVGLIVDFNRVLKDIRLFNRKVKRQPVKTNMDRYNFRPTIGEFYERKLKEDSSDSRYRSVPGDKHDEFTVRCRSNAIQSFINKLRPEGDATKNVRGRARRIGVVEHNYQMFPLSSVRHDWGEWMSFGLSIGRGKPTIFDLPPDDGLGDPLNRKAKWERTETRMYVHHSKAIWRIVMQVPYQYWATALRRYQMGMMIAVTVEDRECGQHVAFPVCRGLSPDTKVRIENAPFMSAAIQHALFKLQFLLSKWDREYSTELSLPGAYSHSMCMPLVEHPRRMAPCSRYQDYNHNYQGTVTHILNLIGQCGQSDLWMPRENASSLQRVARSVQVEDEQLRMAIEAEPEPVRNRVLRLDA